MASSEAIAIERLGPRDVTAGLALSDAAGWNQTDADWSFFIEHGHAVGARDDAGTLIATAAALPYDAATGWVSMVLVAAAHRHRGIASQLVDACVASLRESGRTPVLDATPAGMPVYAKIGFAAGFAFERWEREVVSPRAARSEGTPHDEAGGGAGVQQDGAADHSGTRSERTRDVRIVGASAAQAETLIELDRRAGGVDRGALLRALLARPDTCAWLAAGGDGFAVRRAGRRALQLGPIVAVDIGAALALLRAALDDGDGRVFIDVPTQRSALAGELARRGFVRQRPFVRMALGDTRAAPARRDVFALAGPEFG